MLKRFGLMMGTTFMALAVHADEGKLQAPLSGLAKILACENALKTPIQVSIPTTSPQNEKISATLQSEVIGQDHAVELITSTLEVAFAGMNDPNRPLATLFLQGPTGVGKTEIAFAIIKALGGQPSDLIKIAGEEYQSFHRHTRLIGTTAGHVGMDETPLLHNKNLKKFQISFRKPNGKTMYINVLLWDEAEKSDKGISNMLLGALDKAKMSMGDGSTSDFARTIFIATSNLGVDKANKIIGEKRESLSKLSAGQLLSPEEADLTGRFDLKLRAALFKAYNDALDEHYTPEFRNRLGAVVSFLHLGPQELRLVLQKFLARFQLRIFEQAAAAIGIELTDAARELVISKGTSTERGARPMLPALDQMVGYPLAKSINAGIIREGDMVVVDEQNGRLNFEIVARGLSEAQMRDFGSERYPGFGLEKANFQKADEQVPEGNAEDNQSPSFQERGEEDFVEMLNHNKKAARHLFLVSKNVDSASASLTAVDGSAKNVLLKYVYLPESQMFLKLQLVGESVQVSLRETPDYKAHVFTVDKVNHWTRSEILQIIAEKTERAL